MSDTRSHNSPSNNHLTANVCTKIVAHNLCIGCGLCAGLCPHHNLRIDFNSFGEYVAFKEGTDCPATCGLCLEVCPFYDNKHNEDTFGKMLFAPIHGIKHTPETGYYLNSFVGYSNVNGHRENGASGGLATWTLEYLLCHGEVDAVACVGRIDSSGKLYEFRICTTPGEIRQCSQSAYYPVEVSQIIRYILENDGRYAMIALPCVCKAIRLAQQKVSKLHNRIKYLFGLTCGHTCSKHFAEYLCALGGGKPTSLKEICFRKKKPGEPVSNYGMDFLCDDGIAVQRGSVLGREGFGNAFGAGLFKLSGCFYCDDVFAECADATFMDAWLPKYEKDTKGHSIVLVRNRKIGEILSTADSLSMSHLAIEDVIQSQAPVLRLKRHDISVHLYNRKKHNEPFPAKRQSLLTSRTLPLAHHRKVTTLGHIADKSAHLWVECNGNIETFQMTMQPLLRRLWIYNQLSLLHLLPDRIFKRLSRFRWLRSVFYSK